MPFAARAEGRIERMWRILLEHGKSAGHALWGIGRHRQRYLG